MLCAALISPLLQRATPLLLMSLTLVTVTEKYAFHICLCLFDIGAVKCIKSIWLELLRGTRVR